MIIMVAWRWVQHSPILGQPASSQTVCRPCSRTIGFGLGIFAPHGRFDPDPVRLAQDGAIGPVRLFGVPQGGAAVFLGLVENGGHGPYI